MNHYSKGNDMWDFRLLDVSEDNGGTPFIQLVEVYYNDKSGAPQGYSEPCTGSETVEGMKKLLSWYALALEKPVLKKSEHFGKLKGAVK
jgi:hypothetical protein